MYVCIDDHWRVAFSKIMSTEASAQRSAFGFLLLLVPNSTSRLIASARDGRSAWKRLQSSTIRRKPSDTRI
jgi:hypothetical protein